MGNEAADGRSQGLNSRVVGVAQNIRMAGALVAAAVSVGLFSKEVQRILALPPLLRNDLYLALLALVFLLTEAGSGAG